MRVMTAQSVAFMATHGIPDRFDDSNSLFFYQDLTKHRLPCFLKVQYDHMLPQERSQAVRSRFLTQWFFRLAHEKSPRAKEFHNLFAMYVFRQTDLGRDCARKVTEPECAENMVPSNDSVCGIIWIQLLKDCGSATSDVKKHFKANYASHKQARSEDAAGNDLGRARTDTRGDDDDDDGAAAFSGAGTVDADTSGANSGESDMTAAERVVVSMDMERRRLNASRGRNGNGGSMTALQALASGVPSTKSYPFDLSGPADFSILVGIPTALPMLNYVNKEPAYESAWNEPERYFSFKYLKIPTDGIVPGSMLVNNGTDRYIARRPNVHNLWAVSVRELWLEGPNPGEVSFNSTLFNTLVARDLVGITAIEKSTFNCYDPYGLARELPNGLCPAAMTNISDGFKEEKMILYGEKHAGLTIDDAQDLARRYLELECEIGAEDDIDAIRDKKMDQHEIVRQVEQFVAVFGPKRRKLIMKGLELTRMGLTPSSFAPLSQSSKDLGKELENIHLKAEQNPQFLRKLWHPVKYRFTGLTLYQHTYAYMLNTMSLMHMYSLHTLAPIFYLAMASMPWERAPSLMPLHLMLVGRAALGKSFFIETICSLAFNGLTNLMTSMSTKFFAAKPASGCVEGPLAGTCIVMSEINSDWFDTSSNKNREQATFLKSILTEQTLAFTRLEKPPDSNSFESQRASVANFSALIAAGNSALKDAAILDRFVTIAPPERLRSDNRKATHLTQSTLVEDLVSKENTRKAYQALSVALGFINHAISSGVLEPPQPISIIMQEKLYENECLKFGAEKNTSRMSSVLQRISSHAALHGAATAVFRGRAEFLPFDKRKPNSTECAMHIEALAAVPADLDQTLHFTALQSKNFEPLTRMGMQMLAVAVLGFSDASCNSDDLEERGKYLKFYHQDLMENQQILIPKLHFAKHPEGVMAAIDTNDMLLNKKGWAFIPLSYWFGNPKVITSNAVPEDDFYPGVGGSKAKQSIDELAVSVFAFLNKNLERHSFQTDATLTREIFWKLYRSENASRQFIDFHKVGGKTYFIFDAEEMRRCLMSDIVKTAVIEARNAASPKGTILITSPRLDSVKDGLSKFEVSKPEHVRTPWHDETCRLMETMDEEEINRICEEGLRDRHPLRSTYCVEFWKKHGCNCFRSKVVMVNNDAYIDSERALEMDLSEKKIEETRNPLRELKYPIEITQFFIKMIALGLNPFDPKVQDLYHPMYNAKTWYPDEGRNELRPFTDAEYPEGKRVRRNNN